MNRGLLGVLGIAALAACVPACANELDTSRTPPPRGSVGEEIFGVICDRVGAQALREDLTGASFRSICHRPQQPDGQFADKVDVTKLPPVVEGAHDESGRVVSVAEQKRHRDYAIGRVESLARRRTELIRAFDKTFPEDMKVPIKDLDNTDETKSCDARGEGTLPRQVADMFGRMTDLYNDGTIPQSTQSIARLVEAFQKSNEAQAAWARISQRQGYRPIETALGVARPVVAYPGLRELSNTTLRLVSADSDPYELNPKRDGEGNRIPVPGPGNTTFNKLLEAAHAELLNAKADDPLAPLVLSSDPAMKGRTLLSRPRDNLEIMKELLYVTDDAFGAPSTTPHYIVRRDARGFAVLSQAAAAGAASISGAPSTASPFFFSGAPENTPRDAAGRALVGADGAPLYEYIETNKTVASRLLDDLRPLFNPDPAAQHETLMDLAGGLYVGLGAHVKAEKKYANGEVVAYDGISPDAPLLDLLYALGVVLGDRGADATLAMAHDLVVDHQPKLARLVGALIDAQELAKKHPEAKIPRDTTFADDALEIIGKIASDPALLKDIVLALGDPATAKLGEVLAKDVSFKDNISYDKNNINGPTLNLTTNSAAGLVTPVDRNAPLTGANRSALQRVLMLLADSKGVTICNKADALLHAKKTLPLLGEVDITLPTLTLNKPFTITIFPDRRYAECGVIKIDDLAVLYIDAMADASHVRVNDPRDRGVPPGTLYLRNDNLRNGDLLFALPAFVPPVISDLLRSIGRPTVGLMSQSSRLTGFWEPDSSTMLATKPEWLDRFAHFDFANDNVNTQTKLMIDGLMGRGLPTALCKEEVIPDPEPASLDASSDKKVRVRRCKDGEYFHQRHPNTLFLLEQAGFYDAMRPLLKAFVKHKAEDLFIDLAKAAYTYYPNKDVSAGECQLAAGKSCLRSGMNSYEPLLAEQLIGDLVPAFNELVKSLSSISVKKCSAPLDAKTGMCPSASVKTVTGVDVVVDATRALVDPGYSKDVLKLTDRKGAVATKKNDGSPVAQITPMYIVTNALNAVDAAFDEYEKQHPEDKGRRENYRRARSQLIDQFFAVSGSGVAKFDNPAVTKLAPVVVDVLRAQLSARCPNSFSGKYEKCAWAAEELTKQATDTLTGPLASTLLELLEIIRRDPAARIEAERLMQYLLDGASANDARASVLASLSDVVQVLSDEQNIIPLLHVLAAATDASEKDPSTGRVVKKSVVDAQMALLARLSGRYHDASGKEICKREIDPNQVLTKSLANLVTPIRDGDFKGQSPLELIMDVIADVNRANPSEPYTGKLVERDYGNVSENVIDFLTNKERGLEQFYEVIRQGTKF